MRWHKWFVRGLVFTIFASAVLGALAYQHWTNPTAVRAQVLANAQAMFPGAFVSVDSASLHLLGFIRVQDLQLVRRDDPNIDIAQVPSAVLYHNKEKMLDGQLSFRKIELHRPRLRVSCSKDGAWNVQGLTAAGKAGQTMPTLVVHDASVQFEDQRGVPSPFKLELSQVNLTLINDPNDTVTIDGTAQSPLLGKIALHGKWRRTSNELNLSVKALGVPLNNALLERLACCFPPDQLSGMQVRGQANVHVQVAYRPASEAPWSYNVHCQVSKTFLLHAALPFPLDNLDASIRCDGDTLRVESLRANSGPTVLTARGVGRLPCLEKNFEATLRAEHVEVDEKLGLRLPERLQPVMRLYQPRGQVTVQLDLARRDGVWGPLSSGGGSQITVLPEGVSACFERFPYPLHKITGAIDYTLPQQRIHVDLTAHAGDRPVSIKGHWHGDGNRIDMKYEVQTTGLPIDATLVAALPGPMRKIVQSFHAAGKVDVKAQMRRQPGDQDFFGEYHIRVQDGTATWDEFPYRLTNLNGLIDLYPTHWTCRNFRGTHGDGAVLIEARSTAPKPGSSQPGIYVELTGQNLPLNDELAAALRTMPPLAKAWNTYQPAGRLNVTATIDRRGPSPDDLEVRVDVKGPTVRPVFFPYTFEDFAGHFHLHEQRLELRRLSAAHGGARWFLERGGIELHPTGALYADLPELQVEQLVMDKELLAAMPPKLRDAVAALRSTDPFRFKTRVIVSQAGGDDALPDVYWDSQAWLNDATMQLGLEFNRITGTIACTGRHNGRHLTGLQGNLVLERAAVFDQPFRNVQGRFHVKPTHPELLLLDLKAPIFGGDIAGQVSFDFHDQPRYELNLTASQIDLDQFGRHNLGNDSRLSGVAVGRLYLTGVGDDPNTLDGHGTLDVPNGKLLNLPFLLDLIKFLGLRWPDRTMFEELHAKYAIRRRRVMVHDLALFGNAVSFTGKGEVNLDGSDLQLDLYPSWARIEQLLPPAVRSVPPAVSKNLLTVEARGKITGNSKDIRFMKKPVPVIVDPLLNIRDRIAGTSPELRRPVEPAPYRPTFPALPVSGLPVSEEAPRR